jgi:RecA-family ATPase
MSNREDLIKDIQSEDANFKPENVSQIRPLDTSKIKAVTYSEMLSSRPTPLELVLFPWLPTQGIAFIYAATGVGKTLFTMNAAYAIARGGNFLKYSCPKPRKLLYIDGEMSYVQIHARFLQIVKQQGELDFPENWNLLTPDKIAPFRLPKICDEIGQSYYNEIIEREKYEVIVIDNLSSLSSIDENNSQEWKIVQDWLMYLRSKGISVIVVHHAGKDSKGYQYLYKISQKTKQKLTSQKEQSSK